MSCSVFASTSIGPLSYADMVLKPLLYRASCQGPSLYSTSVHVPCGTLEACLVGIPVSEPLAMSAHLLSVGGVMQEPGQEILPKEGNVQ